MTDFIFHKTSFAIKLGISTSSRGEKYLYLFEVRHTFSTRAKKNNNNKIKEGTKSRSTCSMIGVPLPLPRHCVTCCSFGRSFNACYEISISGKKPLGRLSDECAHEKTQQKK